MQGDRRVLVLLAGMPEEEKLLDYALSFGRRMGANLELLWLPCQCEPLPIMAEFYQKAARAGISVSLALGEGKHIWEMVKRYITLHPPAPLVAMMVREAENSKDWQGVMTRHLGYPITLVSFKSAKDKPTS